MVIISRIIPNVWSALWNLGPQDPNKSELMTSEKDPSEGVTFLSHLACSVICSWVSTFPEVLTQVWQVVLSTEQIPPCSAKRQPRAILLSRTTSARVQGFLLGSYCFSNRFCSIFKSENEVPDHSLIALTPSQRSRDLPKEVNLESWMPPGNSLWVCGLGLERWQPWKPVKCKGLRTVQVFYSGSPALCPFFCRESWHKPGLGLLTRDRDMDVHC